MDINTVATNFVTFYYNTFDSDRSVGGATKWIFVESRISLLGGVYAFLRRWRLQRHEIDHWEVQLFRRGKTYGVTGNRWSTSWRRWTCSLRSTMACWSSWTATCCWAMSRRTLLSSLRSSKSSQAVLQSGTVSARLCQTACVGYNDMFRLNYG